MNLVAAAKSCMRNYATFRGRASRSEYWFFALFLFIGYMVALAVDVAIMALLSAPIVVVAPLFGLFAIIPTIAVTVRRLHDTNRSGWWYWLPLIPVVGAIVLLIWFCTRGTTGANRFGDDPLAPTNGLIEAVA